MLTIGRLSLGLLLSALLIVISDAIPPNKTSMSIVVIGQDRGDIWETLYELTGPLTERRYSPSNFNNGIGELTISNFSSPNETQLYAIKVIVVPALDTSRELKYQAETLALLKAYFHGEDHPDFLLLLSRFDDNGFESEHSKFIKFIQQVQTFQQTVFGDENLTSTIKTAFLLIQLMSSSNNLRKRRPEGKLASFRIAIEEYTSFPPYIHMTVGENRKRNYNLATENGYTRLPNGQLYPKNVWQLLLSMSATSDSGTKEILTSIMNGRESKMVCEGKLAPTEWEFLKEDIQDFIYLLKDDRNLTVVDTEINVEVDTCFSKFHPALQFQGTIQKKALQLRLQEQNITTKDDLPVSDSEIRKFLGEMSSGVGAIILDEEFGLKMPEYKGPVKVGFGYDVIKGASSNSTPFRPDILLPSSVGYQLPGFVNCKKEFDNSDNAIYEAFSSYWGTAYERLKYLHFPEKDYFSANRFKADLMDGYSMYDQATGNISLSAVLQRYSVSCTLRKNVLQVEDLSEEFRNAVENLTEFTQSSRASVNKWQNFFDKFGSHIVSRGYGGGRVVATLAPNKFENWNDIETTLSAMIYFSPFPVAEVGSPSYKFHGGAFDSETKDLYGMEELERASLLNSWRESLRDDFVMLDHELNLEPVSLAAGLVSEDKREMVDVAIMQLLKGELKYVRKPSRTNPVKSGGRWMTRKREEVDQRRRTENLKESSNNSLSDQDQGHSIHSMGEAPSSSASVSTESFPFRYESFDDHSLNELA